jgi:putative oxidoreductase
MNGKLVVLRKRLLDLVDKISWLGPLLVRITVGVVFVGTGWGKLHNLDGITKYFGELGIPMPHLNAIVASSTEFFGGLLVLVGLLTRLAALPLAFTMVVAILPAKRGDIDGVSTLLGFEEFSYLVMFLWLALAGAGKASLDALLARLWLKEDTTLVRTSPAA